MNIHLQKKNITSANSIIPNGKAMLINFAKFKIKQKVFKEKKKCNGITLVNFPTVAVIWFSLICTQYLVNYGNTVPVYIGSHRPNRLFDHQLETLIIRKSTFLPDIITPLIQKDPPINTNNNNTDRSDRLYGLVGKSVGFSYPWSCCAEGRRFESRLRHYSRRRFSSNQTTGKAFSSEHAIYCK